MNVIVKEAQQITALGIHKWLEDFFGGVNISLADNKNDIIKQVKEEECEFVILDTEWTIIQMSKTLKKLKKIRKDIKILVYGDEDTREYELLFIKSGASGFISKSCTLDQFISAVKLISEGQLYLSQRSLINESRGITESSSPLEQLSKRERQVLDQLLKGKTVNKISEEMRLQQSTISTLKRRIMLKLKARNFVELIKTADSLSYV
jgi:DNA-binding NarL/FixJ family response regulator